MTDVVGMYSRVAFVYDAWTWATERKSLEVALRDANIEDGTSVLEVAVGTGVLFEKILRRNRTGKNVGIHLTEGMLRRARAKAKKTGVPHDLFVADGRELPFSDGSFDVVFNNNMLGVVPDDVRRGVLGEIRRVLKPGGRLVVVMMMEPDRGVGRAVYAIGAVRLGGWRALDVVPLLAAEGFVDIRKTVVTQLGIPSHVVRASAPPR